MTRLADILASRIRHNGPMDVGTFMGVVLAHPRHGYYTSRDPIGAGGDFTTAPEISQMFGEMIGAWAADLWLRLGSPAPFTLAEAGPGHGTLMADALRATRNVPGFHRALRLHLLEVSPVLKDKQALVLGAYDPVWHEDAEAWLRAGEGPLILIANEFFDALPVRQLQRGGGRWHERRISLDGNNRLIFDLAEAEPALAAMVPPHLDHMAREGDIFEIAPARCGFMTHFCAALRRRGGAALIVDYGHAAPGLGDTLQAMRHHAFVPVLDTPGEADLTTHVDFSALAQAARQSGCQTFGPVGQGAFLEALGIHERAQALKAVSGPRQILDIGTALQRLTSDGQMGGLFKVMAVTAGHDIIPAGF